MDKLMTKLYEQAKAVGALENWKDAMHDLDYWPHLRKEIIDDLRSAIQAHQKEIISKGELNGNQSDSRS